MNLLDYIDVPGITDAENDTANTCLRQLRKVQPRNRLRTLYHDVEQTTRHFGIAVPPQFNQVETVMGWPAKAVTALDHRLNLDGFYTPAGGMEVMGIDQLWADNHLDVEAVEAHTSALKYGCAFVAVLAGDQTIGEPQVVIRTLSPTNTTGLWNPITRRLDAALTITQSFGNKPTEVILFLPDRVVTARWTAGRWTATEEEHRLGRCPVAVLRFQPSAEAPLGRSRITRPVMSLTDHAIRTLLRMEIGAEFFSAPRATILGADESMFTDKDGNPLPRWTAYMSDLKLVPRPDDPEAPLPQMQYAPQISMQPLVEELRMVAAMFAGETDIPVGQLGVFHENPASDAAMHTNLLELNKTAERAGTTFGMGWVDAIRMAVMIRDELDESPRELAMLRANYRRPEEVTMAVRADAGLKLRAAEVLGPESEVLMEFLGFTPPQIERVKQERRRSAGNQLLDQIMQRQAARQEAGQQVPEAQPTATPEEA